MDENLIMTLLEEKFGVCRLLNSDTVPEWAINSPVFSITRTYDELSVVCREDLIPEDVICEKGWRALKVEGPLDFSLIGILSRISRVLAEAGVSIFAISTYDTDYVLVKEENISRTVEALSNSCIKIVP